LRKENDPSVVHGKLSSLLVHYDVINWQLQYDWPIWRARKCKTAGGFDSINDLIYPPPDLITRAGRLNDPHEPMLYGVFNKNTALEEVGAQEGDYIHLIGFRIKKNAHIQCCVIGEIDRVHRAGRSMLSDELGAHLLRILQELPYKAAMSFVFVDAFLSSLLRDPSASDNDYLFSRTLRRLLFAKQRALEAICARAQDRDWSPARDGGKACLFSSSRSSVMQRRENFVRFVAQDVIL
jgi:hypothetical protein